MSSIYIHTMALTKQNTDIEFGAFIQAVKGLVVHGKVRGVIRTKAKPNRKAGHVVAIELMTPTTGCLVDREYEEDQPGDPLPAGMLVGVTVPWFARNVITLADGEETRITYKKQVKLENGNKVWKGDFEADENAKRRPVIDAEDADEEKGEDAAAPPSGDDAIPF